MRPAYNPASVINPADQEIIRAITTEIAPQIAGWFGDGAALAESEPTFRRLKWSFFLRYPVRTQQGQRAAVLVKISRQQNNSTLSSAAGAADLRVSSREEFDSLAGIASAFNDATDKFFFIRPLAYLPTWNAIATEEVSAVPIKRILLRPRMALGFASDWQGFESMLERAAEWLKTFHTRMSDVRAEPLAHTRIYERVAEAIQTLETTSALRQYEWLRPTLRGSVQSAESVVAPQSVVHGDFNCNNIMITPDGRVGTLDPSLDRDAIYFDLAKLMVDLEVRIVQVASNGWFIRPPMLKRCRQAILRGYFASHPCDFSVLNLYCALAVIDKWVADEESFQYSTGLRHIAEQLLIGLRRPYYLRLLQKYLTPHAAP